VLDATIFANDTFAALRYAGETSVTSERLLLEYANRVSVRPLVSAYLLREYGIAWYAGEEDVKESFDQTLATYRSLIIDVVETSPVLPRAHAAAAAGLFYAHAADTSDVDYIVDRDMQQAIDSAESLTKFFAEVMSASVEEFQYKSVSPLMQFYTMFNAAADVPYVSATESLLASYDGYLLSNPYLNVAADFPELVEVAERVRLTATADVGS
jgi:hypothetical protein